MSPASHRRSAYGLVAWAHWLVQVCEVGHKTNPTNDRSTETAILPVKRPCFAGSRPFEHKLDRNKGVRKPFRPPKCPDRALLPEGWLRFTNHCRWLSKSERPPHRR